MATVMRATEIADVGCPAGSEWFGRLALDDAEKLQGASRVRLYKAREIVFAPCEKPTSVYLLTAGSVRLYRISENGCELSLGYVRPGEVFGEIAAFCEGPLESFAEATTESVVATIPQRVFREMIGSHHDLAVETARQMEERLAHLEGRIEDLVFRSARGRIARSLLQLARDFGLARGSDLIIDLPLTQTDLAAFTGTTRQTVNATLRMFEREGLTRRERRRIVLSSRDQLCRVAEEDGATR